MDEVSPLYEEMVSKYYKVMIKSKFVKELEAKWGKQIFNIANLTIKTFSEDILDDLKEENKLCTEYTKLLASAKIMFNGEKRNLSQMIPFKNDKDRNIRKLANEATYSFFEENEKRFDEIYDKLVKVRTKIATKLGYKNFTGLGYDRMLRIDYTEDMIKNFRKQILEVLVPLCNDIRKKQRQRLEIDSLKYYDENFNFNSGNAQIKGDSKWIIENGKKMYNELSKETGEFFKTMVERELMDLETKKGKSNGGYCDYIAKYKAPFIFSNFNGTSGDIDVLTHEAGHAFQSYCSSNYKLPEYNFPTLEACEIHSMSMEFLTWPWMSLFFKEDAKKYHFSHLSESITFIPYGVLVDEFQHEVYNNPEATKEDRKMMWRELEKKYLPHRDYENNKFLEKGTYWFQQGHIFKNPFYYIDYTLASMCALQFWKKSLENRENAWKDYLNLCKKGGSESFLNLVDSANLISPFKNGAVKDVVTKAKQWLDSIDDSNL
jgi:M3 family oligoendopeptidase